MAYLNNEVLDNGLTQLTAVTRIDICSALPSTYAEATDDDTGLSLGFYTGLTVTGPEDATPGRRVVIGAATEGDVTKTGSATHWAITDGVDTLWAASTLSGGGQVVTEGNKFNTSQFFISSPGPVTGT